MLPAASTDHKVTPFIDTLFTATSATCVTGLVVVDTGSHWTVFGQLVVLSLIQIGGLGFVTLAIAAVTFTHRKIGLNQRMILQESIAAPHVSGIVRMARFVIKGALIIEGTGALIMAVRFCPEMGFLKGLYTSVFISVSAFCNAGIDIIGTKDKPYVSLVEYNDDPVILVTIAFLIIIGGLGFIVWEDIKNNRFKWRNYKLHSKLVLTTTAFLVVFGTLYIFLSEFNRPSFGDMNLFEKLLNSFFQSVTPRTAGFNSVNTAMFQTTSLRETTIYMLTILMLIGGSSGSTAGGIKTTTFAVLMLNIVTV